MTFEQYIDVVRDWQSRLTPEEVRRCIESLSRMDIVDLPQGVDVSVDRVMAIAAGVASMPVPEVKAAPEPEPPWPRESKKAKLPHVRKFGTGQGSRGRPSERAQALVREQLADGPKPGAEIEAAARAAEISEHALIAAADVLGVRVRKGKWWIPPADKAESTPSQI